MAAPAQNDGVYYVTPQGVRLGVITRVDVGRSDLQGPSLVGYLFQNGSYKTVPRGDDWRNHFIPYDASMARQMNGTAAGLLSGSRRKRKNRRRKSTRKSRR